MEHRSSPILWGLVGLTELEVAGGAGWIGH